MKIVTFDVKPKRRDGTDSTNARHGEIRVFNNEGKTAVVVYEENEENSIGHISPQEALLAARTKAEIVVSTYDSVAFAGCVPVPPEKLAEAMGVV
jgi:hypothetical protein